MGINSDDSSSLICSAPDFYAAMWSLSDLISFIQAAHEFLPYAASQQYIRMKATINKLKGENDYEAVGECESELEDIERRKKEVWPQVIWGSVLVSIYAAFEHGIEQTFISWKAVFNSTPSFSQKRGQDFIAAAEEFATKQINIPLFPDRSLRNTIRDLKALRNSYVHSGSRLSSLPKHIQSKVIDGKYLGCSIIGEQEETRWVASAGTCLYFISHLKTIIRLLGDNCFHEHDRRLNCSSSYFI